MEESAERFHAARGEGDDETKSFCRIMGEVENM
jgi:hypothetical protein